MLLHLRIVGLLLIALSFIHVAFPRYFNWKTELGGLSLINRQMMYVHMFFIALVVMMMGILCIAFPEELTQTVFGKQIALGLALFWLIRLFVQLFIYSSRLWLGKRFETSIHILFSCLWIYFIGVFTSVYFS